VGGAPVVPPQGVRGVQRVVGRGRSVAPRARRAHRRGAAVVAAGAGRVRHAVAARAPRGAHGAAPSDARGRAVQVSPVKPTWKAPGTQRLKLK
jgi:hypothetical protein